MNFMEGLREAYKSTAGKIFLATTYFFLAIGIKDEHLIGKPPKEPNPPEKILYVETEITKIERMRLYNYGTDAEADSMTMNLDKIVSSSEYGLIRDEYEQEKEDFNKKNEEYTNKLNKLLLIKIAYLLPGTIYLLYKNMQEIKRIKKNSKKE